MKHIYNLLFLSISVFSFSIAKSQTDITPKGLINPSFGLNGGDVYANQIAITNDGYTYAAGRFNNTVDFDLTKDSFNISSIYSYDMFISKYDKQSNLIFAFKLSGLSEYKNITAIATDKDDNIYIAGHFSKTVDFDPGPGKTELTTPNYYTCYFFIAKYDKSGNFIFVKPIVTTEDFSRIGDITLLKVDDSANIFIAGYGKPQSIDFDPGNPVVHAESHGNYDAFFAKYDANGNYIFSKAVGSSNDDFCNKLAINKNGDIVIIGSFANAANDFDPNAGKITLPIKGMSDAFIGIYDAAGNYKYAFSLGGARSDNADGISTDNDSNIIVSGIFFGKVDFAPDSNVVRRSSDSDYDYFLAKYSQLGKLIFVTSIHAASPGFSSVAIDADNNIYLTGNYIKMILFDAHDSLTSKLNSNVFITKYTSSGIYNFSSQIQASNFVSINSTVLKSKNQFCIAGSFYDTCYFTSLITKRITTPNPNSFIAIYNTLTGNNVGAKAFGTYRKFNTESAIVKITHDEQNNTYVAGTFEGIVDFDPGISQYILTSSQDAYSRQLFTSITDDIFFAKYNEAGKLIFAKNIGGTAGQAPVSIAVDVNHNIYLAGIYEDKIDADPGNDRAILKQAHDPSFYDAYFIGKYDSSGNYIFAEPIYLNGNLNALSVDNNNNIYIAGIFNSGYFDPDNDTSRVAVDGGYIFFSKYNRNGKFKYIKSMGTKGKYQGFSDMAVNNKGLIFICGTLMGSNVDFDPGPGTYYANAGAVNSHFLAAYKNNGDFLFETNSVSLNSTSGAIAVNLKLENQGNVWLSGMFNGTVNFSSNSDSLIFTAKGANNAFFIKYNSKGIPLFVKNITEYKDGVGNFLLESATLDDKNNFYLGGYFYGKVDFDPGADTAYITADRSMNSSVNLFLAKYDSAGNYTYAYNFAPTDSFFSRGAYAIDMYVNKKYDLLFAVNTNGKIDFDPGPDTLYYYPPFNVYPTGNQGYSFVLVKFKQTQTVKPFTIYASTSKPDIDKVSTFSLNKLAKYLR